MGAVAGGRPLASPGMRVLARFLDALIVGLVFGSVLSGVSCVTCYFSLRAARRPPGES